MAKKQFAALPFRRRGDDVRVLLITTRRKGRWSVPKGRPIVARTPHRTAEIEAYEEAGLIGKMSSRSIGSYAHRKPKGKRTIKYKVRLYAMQVREQKADWPERHQRKTAWLSVSEAAGLVHKSGLRKLIQRFATAVHGR